MIELHDPLPILRQLLCFWGLVVFVHTKSSIVTAHFAFRLNQHHLDTMY
jgi:hypothetical protein